MSPPPSPPSEPGWGGGSGGGLDQTRTAHQDAPLSASQTLHRRQAPGLGLVTRHMRPETSTQGFKPIPEGGPHRSTDGCTCAHDLLAARLATLLTPTEGESHHTWFWFWFHIRMDQTTVPGAGGAHGGVALCIRSEDIFGAAVCVHLHPGCCPMWGRFIHVLGGAKWAAHIHVWPRCQLMRRLDTEHLVTTKAGPRGRGPQREPGTQREPGPQREPGRATCRQACSTPCLISAGPAPPEWEAGGCGLSGLFPHLSAK